MSGDLVKLGDAPLTGYQAYIANIGASTSLSGRRVGGGVGGVTVCFAVNVLPILGSLVDTDILRKNP